MINRTMSMQNFEVREAENDEKIIEGYFAVFNSPYVLNDGAYETVSKGAFSDTLENDIRALINHDTSLVLGRTKSGTLELFEDEHGLYGRIKVNPKDTDAMNIYERVKRGDVSQCSFGFEITEETAEVESGDVVHFTIEKVRLYEVSVVTFPRYEATEVSARCTQADNFRKAEEWKVRTLAKLKGE